MLEDKSKSPIIEISSKNFKSKSYRLTLKDRLCEIIDEFFVKFFLNYRKIIKKSIECFRNIMNIKFDNKIICYKNCYNEITSIKFMFLDDIGK